MKFKLWLENNTNKLMISQLFERGINRNDTSILGFHGTSLITIQKALQTGLLPVTTGSAESSAGTHRSAKKAYGDDLSGYGFHIVPNPKNKIIQQINFTKPLLQDAYEEGLKWAKFNANRYSFFDKYNMNLSDPLHHKISQEFMWKSKTEKEIQKQYELDQPKKEFVNSGVLLAISETAAHDFKIFPGGDGDDLNIATKNLPIKYISGIEPADDHAFDWFESLTENGL